MQNYLIPNICFCYRLIKIIYSNEISSVKADKRTRTYFIPTYFWRITFYLLMLDNKIKTHILQKQDLFMKQNPENKNSSDLPPQSLHYTVTFMNNRYVQPVWINCLEFSILDIRTSTIFIRRSNYYKLFIYLTE